jgi:hypothetical protein
MKSLMLLNARRRRKSSRRRRNPSAGYTRSYGDAFDAMKRRRKASSRRATSRRRRTGVIVRRIGGRRRHAAIVRARKIYVSRPSRKSALIVARNPRRRRSGGFRLLNPLIPGNIMGQVRGLFSKDNLTTAAGGVAAAVVANYLTSMTTSGGKFLLPRPADATSTAAKATTVAYTIGIPFAAAMVTRRFSPAAARGMVLGGLINGALKAWKLFGAESYTKVLGTSEYLDAVGAYGTPSFQASNMSSRTSAFSGALDNNGAFAASAW